jgi:hypothetical protein
VRQISSRKKDEVSIKEGFASRTADLDQNMPVQFQKSMFASIEGNFS